MRPALVRAEAEARLLVLLDDAARRLLQDGPVAVHLTDDPRDIATLGLASLYAADPLRSYGTPTLRFARLAATRFGSLHQTLADPARIGAAAQAEGFRLISGQTSGPGPFAAPDVQALLAAVERPNDLVRAALRPLLGAQLLQTGTNWP